ncbi:helix-hairpin-helix domain-containing protein [Streptomyces olivaceus]|uniref:helix-hairpin-helix domain-containing protein n=1 Tax=Streptomyces olivaceus TaxID=47716 RepID=UPI001CCAEA9E|nr:helix-hairpin-helix domain-containing protein [Streptomyces olivaceus]MBZ6290436.1 helix-hairpin-helix domain-containing protein [Streptomyces olivaceus]MBZ6324388.1 helix-hairpin-helix domain-containing protein [Streptomyces olivaceus]
MDVQGRCPACGGTSLFLGEGGHVTCSRIDCPAPGEADDLLHGQDSVYAIGRALGGTRVARMIAYAIAAHGRSLADVQRMTDEELRAIPGIGNESLSRIRAAIPAPSPGEQAAPVVGRARIALDVSPGLADGIDRDRRSVLPEVEFEGAEILRLQGSPGKTRMVLGVDSRSSVTVNGVRYTVSTEHPVVVEPLGSGAEGGFVTLTLFTRKTLVNGTEVGDT